MTRRPDMRDVFSHVAFMVLSILAVLWYESRMYADAAYYLFHAINLETFHIEHGRFVLAISQFIPLLSVKLGLPLKLILVLYSVGHVLFYYCLFLIARYRYQSKGAGILLILLQVLALEMGYFSPMFELYYGTAGLVLAGSILWSNRRGAGDYILLIILIGFILSSHPMAVLLTCFTFVLHFIEFRNREIQMYFGLVIFLGLYGLWKWVSASEYESGVASSVLSTYRTMPYGKDYLVTAAGFLLRYYWELLMLLLLTLYWMAHSKRYAGVAFVAFSFIGMYVVIHGVHYGFQHSRYQEQVYFPLSYIAAFPLCLLLDGEKMQTMLGKATVLSVLSLLFIVRIISIAQEAPNFERRIEMMERQITVAQSHNWDKAISGEANVTRQTSVDPNWSYGIETLLLSARGGPERSVSIVFDTDLDFENNRSILRDDEFLMRKWDIRPLTWLNADYFSLAPGTYYSLKGETQLDTVSDTLIQAFELDLSDEQCRIKSNNWTVVDVVVVNRSHLILPADTSQGIYLAYHWMLGDSTVTWDGHRTAFEVMIEPGSWRQTMDILAPDAPGEYTLIADIVAEDRQWFGLNASCKADIY